MVDLHRAFTGDFVGLSIWLTHDGRYQCNLKRRNGAFAIGVADTIKEAWAMAWHNGGDKLKPLTRQRDVEDLA